MTPLDVAAAAIAYCGWSRGSITSWGRSPERNEKVGGHEQSKHLTWLAFDVGYDPNPMPDEEQATKMASNLGMKLIRFGNYDHLQVK